MKKTGAVFSPVRLFRALDATPSSSGIYTVAKSQGCSVYLTGGFIRDILLGITSACDMDFSVSGDAAGMAAGFAQETAAALVALDPERGTYRVAKRIADQLWCWDFTSLHGATIHEDLNRRDFTINAIALPIIPRRDRLLDPTGGLLDLSGRIIRHTHKEALSADPIRRLRAYRLAAQLEFEIHPGTRELLPGQDLTGSVAGERIREEVAALLSAPGSLPLVSDLIQSGLLNSLWPTNGPDLEYLSRFEDYTRRFLDSAGISKLLVDFLSTSSTHAISHQTLLKMVCLAFPRNTPPWEELGKTAARLESMAHGLILGRRAEQFLIRTIEALHYQHSRPDSLKAPEGWWAFFDSFGQAGIGSHVLFNALDFPGGASPARPEEIADFYYQTYLPDLEKENLISAEEVCRLTGMGPGPDLGKLLKRLNLARRLNIITTPEEATDYVRKLRLE